MKKSLSLYLIISLAAQPLVAAQEASNKNKIMATSIAMATLTAATIAYLLLTKSDKQICDKFMHTVTEEVDALSYAQNGTAITNVFDSNIPPLFSSERSLDKTSVYSRDSRYRADIEHRMTKKYGRHFHEFSARYYRNQSESQHQYSHTLVQVARDHKKEPLEKKR